MLLTTEQEYTDATAEFERLARESQQQHRPRLLELRDAIDTYENDNGHAPDYPKTVAALLELEMFKRHLKQKGMAQLLEVPETRLSEILRGRRGMNLDFARRMHTRLEIPGDLLLALKA